jgi:beta-aspartyl-peptidase (threonine type)
MRKVSEITQLLLLAMLLVAVLPVAEAAVGNKDDEAVASEAATSQAAIRAELDEEVAAWNHGNLKGYMKGYWHSPELTFFAGSQELSGWEAAYQRYRTAFLGKDKEMGRLEFSNLRIEVLSPDAALVRGGWQLTMKDRSQRRGLFTIVLKKFSEGWLIIHDHSS